MAIPSGYQQIEYLLGAHLSGNSVQYVYLGYSLEVGQTAINSAQATQYTAGSNNGVGWGICDGGYEWGRFIGAYVRNNSPCQYRSLGLPNVEVSNETNCVSFGRYTETIKVTGVNAGSYSMVGSSSYSNSISNLDPVTYDLKCYAFGYPSTCCNRQGFKLYYQKILDNATGNVLHYVVPVINSNTGKYCLCDTVESRIIELKGTDGNYISVSGPSGSSSTLNTTVSPTGAGTITGAGSYLTQKTVTVNATPNNGYKFVRWLTDGQEVSKANPYSFVLTGNTTITGEFKKKTRLRHLISAQTTPPPVPEYFDYVDENEYDEIDLLFTTDVHGTWLEGNFQYQRSGWPAPGFAYKTNDTYQSLQAYRDYLETNGIKTLILDGGDYSHCSGLTTQEEEPEINKTNGLAAIQRMNDVGYFSATIGNHEYKTGVDEEYGTLVIENVLKKFKGNSNECSIISCNLFDKATGNLVFKPYKTAKIGSKKIAVIGMGCSGFDGPTDEWNANYSVIDGESLYSLIQTYIDYFKGRNFDYIVVTPHCGEEGESRWSAGWGNLIANTSGISILCPSHSHSDSDSQTRTDKDGNTVHIAAQPRCAFQYISRIRLQSSGISSIKVSTY